MSPEIDVGARSEGVRRAAAAAAAAPPHIGLMSALCNQTQCKLTRREPSDAARLSLLRRGAACRH